ncbi:MAG: hypothetical protein ACK5H1_02490 [Tenacibaculum sp.]
MEKIDFATLIKESEADAGLVFNSEGYVLDSHKVSNQNNVSAMASVLTTMSDEFLQDIMAAKSSNSISLASEKGLVLINKYNNDNIVCLMTKDISKLGVMKLTLKKVMPKQFNK